MKKEKNYLRAELELILFENLGYAADIITASGTWEEPQKSGDSDVDPDGWL